MNQKNVGFRIMNRQIAGLGTMNQKNVDLRIMNEKNVGLRIMKQKNVRVRIMNQKDVGLPHVKIFVIVFSSYRFLHTFPHL
jgi:hypothetical protein